VRQILSFAQGVSGERQLVQVKHILRDMRIVITETFPRDIQLLFSIPGGRGHRGRFAIVEMEG